MKSYAERWEAEAVRRARESRLRSPEDHQRLFPVAQRLAEAEYHFARTMNYIPHSYTLRKTWASDAEFVDTIKMIDEYHYEERFRGGKYRRLAFNGYVYWGSAWKPIDWPDGSPATYQLINRLRRRGVTYQSPWDEVASFYDAGGPGAAGEPPRPVEVLTTTSATRCARSSSRTCGRRGPFSTSAVGQGFCWIASRCSPASRPARSPPPAAATPESTSRT